MKVKVYFRDGHKAVFEGERVLFMREDYIGFREAIPKAISSGIAVVNWESVCFVRRIEEEEDLLDDE